MFDIFIKRPVLATVISLLILLLGLQSIFSLQIRQYPELFNTTITVTTTFPGADADLMQGFITDPIQKAVATADGIDYLTSRSYAGTSVVTVKVRLNDDPDAAMTAVTAKVNQTRSFLPRGINDPVIVKSTGDQFASMYLAFSSDTMSPGQITDYVSRVIQPKLSTVRGVADPELFGGQKFAMRIWLDPVRMAQHSISAGEVQASIEANNYLAAAGSAKGYFDVVGTTARTDLRSEQEFRDMVILNRGAQLVRLSDIANVELGPESSDSSVYVNGDKAVFIGIKTAPDANPLTVIDDVRALIPSLEANLPAGMKMQIAYDATIFIRASIEEVMKTIGEAALIVMVVIFLFMGSMRSVLIPLVTMPLSLIGVCLFLLILGFSINLLTLLAMVLAIGLVVDDAIVVVENVHRHIEEGLSPFQAALVGTREISGPVISMTITLAAVYAPIAFMTGLTGALFKEFALTLAGAVIVSGIIALTLSPMMCSKLLKHDPDKRGLAHRIDVTFDAIRNFYLRLLGASLRDRAATIVFAIIVSGALFMLFQVIQRELAPTEDQGAGFMAYAGPTDANLDYMDRYGDAMKKSVQQIPEIDGFFTINGTDGTNQGFGVAVLKTWTERTRGQAAVLQDLTGLLGAISGINAAVFPVPSLPGADGVPIQFVINTTADYRTLNDVVQRFMDKLKQSGMMVFYSDTDLKFEKPQTIVEIDRDKAAAYGVTMAGIAQTLATMTGGNYVNQMNLYNKSYQVIPQVARVDRLDPAKLGDFYLQTASRKTIPLGSLVTLRQEVQPIALNQFNQQNAVTIQAVMMATLGDALAKMDEIAKEVLPAGFTVDYAGQSRQYIQEGSAFYVTLAFAIAIIYLVLAAQFESLRDPLVIMISVPLSVCGALIPLALGFSTMNIYSQVGLVTLVGLITKHGILICEVAKEQQEKFGKSKLDAVEIAAGLRLRPVLMTTAAMVAGLIPLMFASGAGAASRQSIAIVIIAGMSVGTLFTLFVLPVFYTFLASNHAKAKPGEITEAQPSHDGPVYPATIEG
ncbi:efflux RND transporter permease subunit [Dongia sp.]|jgi:multidrug efflux pump|uniref:efflux RND transporter permease subunit n=1 Tax=Dongia sp. TaxID=1977262 RepID=UPI0035AED879